MADKRRTTDPPRTRWLIALAPLLWAAGCGSPGSEQRVVTVWAMGREGEVVGDLLPQFARAHPDIVVRVQQLPWYAAHEKLLTAFAGDATPDVCLLGNTWIPEFVALKALEPLDEPLAHSGVVRREDYFPGIWDTNVVGGARYGVLWPLNEFEPLMVLALQQGDPLLRDGGRYGNFESPGFRRAFAYYLEMFRRQWAPPVANTQISNAWEELGRGYYSFYINGPWNIGEFRRRLPPEQQGSWMTAPMPGPEGPGASVASGASLVIFRRSRHREDAWRLVEFLSDPEVQKRFYELTGDLPPRRSTWSEPTLAENVYARAFREQLERVKPTPKVAEWERIMITMQLMAERVVHGDEPPEEGLRQLDRDVDAMLQK